MISMYQSRDSLVSVRDTRGWPRWTFSLGALLSYVLYGDWLRSSLASGSGVCLRAPPGVALSCAAINVLNRESGLLTSCAYVPDSVI